MNQLTFKRDGQTFVFRYPDHRKTDMLREVAKMASCPNSSLTWYDAAIISQRARELHHGKIMNKTEGLNARLSRGHRKNG